MAVIIPLRDGAYLIRECVDAVRKQTRRPDEVVIVVGPSEDDSGDAARSLEGGSIHVLDNPAGDRGSAINVALESATADLIAMVDAQARLAPDYLASAARALEDASVAVAGGPMRPIGIGPVGQAMAAALRSPFGVGDSQFHFDGTARDVESVYLGVYRRAVFDRVGRYNPSLLRTEDDDLNARVREAGLRIRLDPTIRSTYMCRESLEAIWHQYHGYGFWKVALATIRPFAIRPRHLAPLALVAALLGAFVLGIAGSWLPLAVTAGAWGVAAIAFAVSAPADSVRARILFPVVTLVMHLAYGLGTLQGLVSWPRLARQVRAGAMAGARR